MGRSTVLRCAYRFAAASVLTLVSFTATRAAGPTGHSTDVDTRNRDPFGEASDDPFGGAPVVKQVRAPGAASAADKRSRVTNRPGFTILGSSPAETRIFAALNEPTSFEFVETPLRDIVEYLKDLHEIEILLYEKALNDVGVGRDVSVTSNFKGTALRPALRLILREVGLAYVVRDDVLLITTPQDAEQFVRTRVIDLEGLMDGESEDEIATIIRSLLHVPELPPSGRARPTPGGRNMIQMIFYDGRLIARGTPSQHDELTEVLGTLAQLRKGPEE